MPKNKKKTKKNKSAENANVSEIDKVAENAQIAQIAKKSRYCRDWNLEISWNVQNLCLFWKIRRLFDTMLDFYLKSVTLADLQ